MCFKSPKVAPIAAAPAPPPPPPILATASGLTGTGPLGEATTVAGIRKKSSRDSLKIDLPTDGYGPGNGLNIQ